jgi:putative sterol carrier protein
MSTHTVRYLSLEWIDALTEAVASNQAIALLASEHNIGITQTVTGGPEGEVTYHLQVGDGHATFGAGAAEPEDVRFEQDWETATAVATDKLNAQQAFITGRIRLYGDQEKLLANTPVFAALDEVFGAVRTFTEYR